MAHTSRRLEWNDLQLVLAVAEHGSLSGAARSLGVNHTTVLRRIQALEATLGVRLFDRLPTGYALDAAGEELAEAARRMEESVLAVERRLAGRDRRLTGTVRVATTDTLAASILPSGLAELRRRHPGVQIELAISNALADLGKRDADIAVRPASKPPAHLVGRRIGEVAFAIYASPSYLETHRARALERYSWLAPDASLASTTLARWMAERLPSAPIALHASSFVALRDAAVAGLGVVALPCYLGDLSPGLRRLRRRTVPELSTELWVLMHQDLRRTARVRALADVLIEELGLRRPLLEGGAPNADSR